MTPTPLEQPTRPTWWDWLLAGGLALVTAVPYLLSEPMLGLIGLAQVAPLVWRRVRPLPVFGVVALATLAQVPFSDYVALSNVALMVALYAVIAWISDRRWLSGVLMVCAIGVVVAGLDWGRIGPSDEATLSASAVVTTMVLCVTITAATAALGLAARRRRELMIELRARATDAERERDQHAQLAAQTERTRIARDMHDVIAHALAVIVVQSDGASYAVRHSGSPDAATEALEAIGGTSRHALAETRRLVGALREEGETAELAPSFGAADIDALVSGVRDAGLSVDLHTDDVDRVPPAAGAAAYRVVQEALTNVIKHAGRDATATVVAQRTDGELRIQVADTGRGLLPGAADQRGYGLLGMRERVTVLGGRLSAGSNRGGGFVVEATIPCHDTESEPHV